jgi:hypothetical protein
MLVEKSSEPWYYARKCLRNRLRGVVHVVFTFLISSLCGNNILNREKFMAKVRSKDAAKYAGLSIATVSHVVNNTRYVSAATRQKVLDAIFGASLSSCPREPHPDHPDRRRLR